LLRVDSKDLRVLRIATLQSKTGKKFCEKEGGRRSALEEANRGENVEKEVVSTERRGRRIVAERDLSMHWTQRRSTMSGIGSSIEDGPFGERIFLRGDARYASPGTTLGSRDCFSVSSVHLLFLQKSSASEGGHGGSKVGPRGASEKTRSWGGDRGGKEVFGSSNEAKQRAT